MADPKITPCLWFDFRAEEAVAHYLDVFGNGRIVDMSRYDAQTPEIGGKVLMIEFELFGQRFRALNGGPQFPHTEAISLAVDCDDQAEVDRLWSRLTADGGRESMCGWLKDRFGVSWQIVPRRFAELMKQGTPEQNRRMFAALMPMKRLDLAALEAAWLGR
jgi:predicted 3-demethylubiquinone-9 3-methyltransferase (glyoxalase superfamily)